MILEPTYGDDPLGAAYSYYHDPDILHESPTSESPVQQGFTTEAASSHGAPSSLFNMGFASAPAALAAVPRTAGATLPSSDQGGAQTQSPPAGAAPARLSSPEIKQEPEDESTVSPDTPVAREGSLAAHVARGRLQALRTEALEGERGTSVREPLRMDTLPLTGIAADSPTASSGVVDIPAPSINPMAIMPASNHTEQTHRIKHELDVIAHSPPPQVFTANVIEPNGAVSGPNPEESDWGQEEDEDGQDLDMLDISDSYTPPPFSVSSGPSVENTPDTRISDTFTASPSPRLPQHDGEVQNGVNPGASSPQRFQCDICGREFDLFHKLK